MLNKSSLTTTLSNHGLMNDDLQDLAYDLEDVLDDFAAHAQLFKLKDALKLADDNNMVQSIFASGSQVAKSFSTLFKTDNPDMQTRIDDINDRLKDIQSQVQSLGLLTGSIMQHQTHHTEAVPRWRETTSLVSEPVIYGRDEKKTEVIGLLVKDMPLCEDYVVVPVVGQGGIGKTTLIQCIYNDMQVVNYFDVRAWVYASDMSDLKKITTSIVISALDETHNVSDLNKAQENLEIISSVDKTLNFSDLNKAQEILEKLLKGKRFLVVLDDVWSDSYDAWYQLQTPFRQGAKGSRVIVTTRIVKIARMMSKNPSHRTIITLQGLSGDDCWRLFQQHTNHHPDLAEIREDIIRKCNGLPLAAKALGGLLKSIVEKSQWQKILNSNVWSEQSSVLPVLKLSYHHLPPHLKRLFAYCSIIPKGKVFNVKNIVLMWMAEGFLQENKQERMEDIGHDYFHDLVSRSLFQSYGGTFRMHDLIHDLAQWVAGDICFTLNSTETQRVCNRARHFSVTAEVKDKRLVRQLLAFEAGGKLRTILHSQSYNDIYTRFLDLIPRFRSIRVLSLSSSKIEVLPSHIGDLKQLRYLNLSATRIKELPESTSNLLNLQTLIITYCDALKRLPSTLRLLVNLRHLSYTETSLQVPLGIGKLTNLQSLDRFVLVAGHGFMIRELKNLKNLHETLSIGGLENVINIRDVQEARIHQKKSLDELHMKWGMCQDEVDENIKTIVLEQLRPHTSIKVCKIDGFKGLTFPVWLGDPCFTHMVSLRLVDCEKCECLRPLGQLSSLKELWVEGMAGIKELGSEFYGYGCLNPFPALKNLSFKRMNSWVKWLHPSDDTNRAFPCLEELTIKHCPLLQSSLPSHIPALKNLVIFNCRQFSVTLPCLVSLRTLMVDCKQLSSTAPAIFCSKMMNLRNISEFSILPSHCLYLEELIIINCCSILTLDKIPLMLRRLTVDNCQKLQCVKFDESPTCLSFVEQVSLENCVSVVTVEHIPFTLKRMQIKNCEELQFVAFEGSSTSVGKEVSLEEVVIDGCNSLKYLFSRDVDSLEVTQNLLSIPPKATYEFVRLTHLTISNCAGLVSLPCLLPQIRKLKLSNCENLEALPNQMDKFSSLEYLVITKCPKIHCFPEGGLPKNLKELKIHEVPIQDLKLQPGCLEVLRLVKLDIQQPIQELGLQLFTSVQVLELSYISCLFDTIESISVPSSLKELIIWGFKDLKSISCCSLPNLTKLNVGYCPNLESLHEYWLHTKLRDVQIYQCPLLEQQCKRDHLGRVLHGASSS